MRTGGGFRCRWQWILRAVLVVVLFRAFCATVLAGGPLAFLDDAPLELTGPPGPAYVTVVNGGAEPVEGVRFRVVALRGPKGTFLGDNILSITATPGAVAAHSVETFELTFALTATDVVAEGVYEGFLVAEASGASPIQKPLTWQIGPQSSADTPLPASDSLSFLDDETLELSEGDEPAYVALVNSGAEPVEDIHFTVAVLRGPNGGLLGDNALSVTASPNTLDGYSVATFELSTRSVVALDDGVYSGTLVVEASGVKPIHKALTWEKGHGRVTLAGLTPETDSLTVGGIRRGWPTFFGTEQQIAMDLATLRLYGTDADRLNLEEMAPVRTTLSTEDGETAVVSLGRFVAGDSDTELVGTLGLSGLTASGKYAGTLMLAPMELEGGKTLAVTAVIRDHWLWPLLFVFSGLLLSWGITRYWKRIRPGKDLERQALVTLAAIKEDHIEFTGKAENGPVKGYTIEESAEGKVEATQDLIARGKLDDAKKELEALVAYFEAYQTFRGWAKALRASYDLVDGLEGTGQKPAIQKVASGLFPGKPVEGPEHLAALTAQVRMLREFYVLFLRIYGRWDQGEDILKKLSEPTNPDDKVVLARAKARLKGVKVDLWNARSAEELLIWRVEPKVEWALDRLRELHQKYPTKARLAEVVMAVPEVIIEVRSVDLAGATPQELEDRAMAIRRFITRFDWLFIFIGWIVAVATAMWALYAGKPFGTGADYLAAFIWGSGVDQGLKGLSGVLSKLGIGQGQVEQGVSG